MKIKSLIIIIFVAIGFLAQGQEKGLFLSLSGNYGANTFRYSLNDQEKSKSERPLSYGAGLSLQYFFTPKWGLSLGAEFFNYNGVSNYQNDWINKGWSDRHYVEDIELLLKQPNNFINRNMEDYNGQNYWSILGLSDWREKQQGYIIQVPLMLQYQTKWGRKQNVGMYWALGVKLQVPVIKSTYTVESGVLRSWAYETSTGVLYRGDTANIPNLGNLHGFGNRADTAYTGNNPLRLGAAASGEIGMLFSFSRRVDFAVAAYLDYGFLDIRKKNSAQNKSLIMPQDNDPHALDNAREVGDGLQYIGYLNSAATDKVNLLAFGAKATLRIKLDKLTDENPEDRMSDREFLASLIQRLIDTIVASKDTFICCPNIRINADAEGDYTAEEGVNAQNSPKKMWNPNNPASPNNPNNPNYAYPAWYVPDYVEDKKSLAENSYTVAATEAVMVDSVAAIQPNLTPVDSNTPENAPVISVVKPNAPESAPVVSVVKTDTSASAPVVSVVKPSASEPTPAASAPAPSTPVSAPKSNTPPKSNGVAVGLLPNQEGPNNPTSVQRNQEKVNAIIETVRSSVYFDLNSSELRREAISTLEEKIAMMKKYPGMTLALIGHTCDLGGTNYNDELSLKRATTVRNYMTKNGIKASRLEIIPMGLHHPDNPNSNEKTRRLNRRVDFIVVQ